MAAVRALHRHVALCTVLVEPPGGTALQGTALQGTAGIAQALQLQAAVGLPRAEAAATAVDTNGALSAVLVQVERGAGVLEVVLAVAADEAGAAAARAVLVAGAAPRAAGRDRRLAVLERGMGAASTMHT